MNDETILWRCRRCGQWSHAKRDPIAHKPIRPDYEDCPPNEWREEWCGPFDRWTAKHNDPTPRDDLPHIGQPCNPDWRDNIVPLPSYDPADVPF